MNIISLWPPAAERVRLPGALQKDQRKFCPWVFQRNGAQIKGFKQSWKTACRKVGLSGHVFHDFRHTAVRRLERAGVPRSVTMRLTGHKTESVYRRYDIVSESDLNDAAARLDEFTGTIGNLSPLAQNSQSQK